MYRRHLFRSMAVALAFLAVGCGEDAVAPSPQFGHGGAHGPPADKKPPAGPFADRIAFLRRAGTAPFTQDIWTVDGGEAQVSTTGTVVEHDWSPDGRRIVFEDGLIGDAEIYVVDVKKGNQTQLTDNPGAPRNIDPEWSPVGASIVFVSDRALANFQIWKMDESGSNPMQLTNAGGNLQPTWSPAGDKVAFFSNRPGFTDGEIFVIDADGTNETRLTIDGGNDGNPRWSPDGSRIAFVRDADIWTMDSADGANKTQLTNDAAPDGDQRWSPDGTKIVFTKGESDASDIWVMNANGTNAVKLTDNALLDEDPWWSPDGTMIAFRSSRDGATGIFVMNADGTDQMRLTTNNAFEGEPRWRP